MWSWTKSCNCYCQRKKMVEKKFTNAVRMLKNDKTAAVDGIIGKILKCGSGLFMEWPCNFFNIWRLYLCLITGRMLLIFFYYTQGKVKTKLLEISLWMSLKICCYNSNYKIARGDNGQNLGMRYSFMPSIRVDSLAGFQEMYEYEK